MEAEQYGHWMLLTATVGIGAILNQGLSAATIKQVSVGRGRDDNSYVQDIIRSALAIGLLGGSVMGCAIFTVFFFAGETFFDKMGARSQINLTGFAASLLLCLEQIDTVFGSALKGAEQFGRAARIEMAGRTLQIISVVLAVAAWNNLAALYASLIVVAGVRLVAKAWVTKFYLSLASIWPYFGNMKDVLHYGKWGWLQGAGGVCFGIADRIMIGSALGATSLAHYSIATQLAQQIHAVSAAALGVLFPSVSRRLAEEPRSSLWSITRFAIAGNLLLSSTLGLGLLIFGKDILSIWVGRIEAVASMDVLWYLTIAYWLLAINVAPHFILLGAGRIRFVAMSNLIAGLLSMGVMWILVQSYGLVGMGVARMVYGILILANYLPLFDYLWRRHREITSGNIPKALAESI